MDLVENRLVGIKSRGAYETPGGTILFEAHRALESITLDRETMHYKQQVALKYAQMVYYGQWFCPLREALDAFVARTQRNVTGSVLDLGVSTGVIEKKGSSLSFKGAILGRGRERARELLKGDKKLTNQITVEIKKKLAE